MSVSSSSDKDAVRQQSEEYRSQIESREKRHQKEVKNIRQQHFEEVRRIEDNYQKQLDSLRSAMRSNLSGKDQYHNDEMNKIHQTHRSRMQKLSEDYQTRLEAAKTHARSEIENERQASQRQRNLLEQKFESNIKKMNEEYNNLAHLSKEKQAEALDNQRRRFESNREKEVTVLNDGHSQRVEKTQQELRTERQARRDEVARLKQRMDQQADAMSKSFRSTLERDRAFHDDALTAQRTAQQDSIKNVKVRYADALEKNSQGQAVANERFREDIHGRITGQVASLKSDKEDLKKQMRGESLKQKAQHDLQMNNLKREMKISNEILSNQKQEAIRGMQERTVDKLQERDAQHQATLHDRIRYYQNEREDTRVKHRMQLNENSQLNNLNKTQAEQRAEDRIKNMQEAKAREERVMRQYFEGSIEQIRDTSQRKKMTLREQYEEDRTKAIAELNQKMQEAQMKHDREQRLARSHFDKEIENLNFSHRSDKDSMIRQHRDTIESLQRGHARELEQYKQASELKLENVNKHHREEIDRMRESHAREMQMLAQTKAKV